jgi:hypothetical protein
MSGKIIVKIIVFGFISWLIPFAVSFLFYKSNGELMISYTKFKSIIMVVGTVSGCYFLEQFFKSVDANFVKYGFIVGLSWITINIILDTLILVPMMNTTFWDYLVSIGLSYVVILAISISMGYLLNRKLKYKCFPKQADSKDL